MPQDPALGFEEFDRAFLGEPEDGGFEAFDAAFEAAEPMGLGEAALKIQPALVRRAARGALSATGTLLQTPETTRTMGVDFLRLFGMDEATATKAVEDTASLWGWGNWAPWLAGPRFLSEQLPALGKQLGGLAQAIPQDEKALSAVPGGEFAGKVYEAGGTSVPFLVASAAAGSPLVAAGLGAALEGTVGQQEATAAGVGPGKRLLTTAGYGALGTLEAFGPEQAFARLGAVFAGLGKRDMTRLGRVILTQAAASGGGELAEEVAQGMGEEALRDILLRNDAVHRDLEDWIDEFGDVLVEQGFPAGVAGVILGGAAAATEAGVERGPEGEVRADVPHRAEPEKPADFEPLTRALSDRAGKPLRPATLTADMQADVAFGKKLGVDVLFVESEDGASLDFPGAYQGGQIVLDARQPTQQRRRQVRFHEISHFVAQTAPEAWTRYVEAATKLAPEQIQEALAAYQSGLRMLGEPTMAADQEEALAVLSEQITGELELAWSDPKKLLDAITKDRSLFDVILDWVKNVANKLGGRFKLSAEQRIARLEQEAFALGSEGVVPVETAAQLALLFKEATETAAALRPRDLVQPSGAKAAAAGQEIGAGVAPEKSAIPVVGEPGALPSTPSARLTRAQVAKAGRLQQQFQEISKKQTRFMGNKREFFAKNAKRVAHFAAENLEQAHTLFDMYAGGGTYGLSFASITEATPNLKRVVVNEVDPWRATRFRLAAESGQQFMAQWHTDPTLIAIRKDIEPLIVGQKSSTPASTALDVAAGVSESDEYQAFAKYQEPLAAASDEVHAAFVALRDVMFSGRTATWGHLFGNASDDANAIKALVESVRRRGVAVELTSIDALSPEAVERVRGAGAGSFVLLDPPYHETASGTYRAGGKAYDFDSDDFLQANLAAARQMSEGNVLLYNNKSTEGVQREVASAFGGRMRMSQWARAKNQQEFVGVYDGRGQGRDVGDVGAAVRPAGGVAAEGERPGVVGEVAGDAGGEPGRRAEGDALGAGSEPAGQEPRFAVARGAALWKKAVALFGRSSLTGPSGFMGTDGTTIWLYDHSDVGQVIDGRLPQGQRDSTRAVYTFMAETGAARIVDGADGAGGFGVEVLGPLTERQRIEVMRLASNADAFYIDVRSPKLEMDEDGFGANETLFSGSAVPADRSRVARLLNQATAAAEGKVKFAVERKTPKPDALGFWSKLELELEARLPNKASRDQVLAIARTVPKEEFEWSGLEKWLADKPSVTKEDVLKFVRENGVRVNETVLDKRQTVGDIVEARAAMARAIDARGEALNWLRNETMATEGGAYIDQVWRAEVLIEHNQSQSADIALSFPARIRYALESFQESVQEVRRAQSELERIQRAENTDRPQFSNYVLPGGENYHEILLTLPEPKPPTAAAPLGPADFRIVVDRIMTYTGQRELRVQRHMAADAMRGERWETVHWRTATRATDAELIAEVVADEIKRDRENALASRAFTHGHFEVPNVLVHIRVDDRVDTHGNKMLFVEEIQSDWHQKGRERGYATETEKRGKLPDGYTVRVVSTEAEASDYSMQAGEWALFDENGDFIVQLGDQFGYEQAYQAALDSAVEAGVELETLGGATIGVPNAPFKTSWHVLALKRVVRLAAEGDYDAVGWTTGAQQIDRYNEAMRQNVDKIEVEPRGDADVDEYSFVTQKRLEHMGARMLLVPNRVHGQPNEYEITWRDGSKVRFAKWLDLSAELRRQWEIDHGGERTPGRVYIRAYKDGEEKFGAEVPLEGTVNLHGHDASLEDVVGKDIARKIREKPGEQQTFEGEGLAIGGKGMQEFYDRILVNAANDIGKKFGVKVETAGIYTRPETIEVAGRPKTITGPPQDVHSLPITTAMREAVVAQGFPRFAVRRPTEAELADVEASTNLAMRQGERTEVGSFPNPIASTSTAPPERALQRGARDVWARDFDPVSRAQQKQVAETRLRDDFEGEKQRLLAKIDRGETLTASETVEADIIKSRAAIEHLSNPTDEGFQEAVRLHWAYMDARTATARSLGVIRDAIDAVRTGQQRLADFVLEMSHDIRRKVNMLRAEARDAATSDARRAQIKAEIDKLLAVEAKRVAKARARLVAAGFDPAFIARDYFKDRATHANIARIVRGAKAGPWDWYLELRLADILSGPLTHAANTTGNATSALLEQHAKRMAQALVNVAVQDRNAPTFGEQVAFYNSWIPGFFQASRNFATAFKTEMPVWEFDLTNNGFDLSGYGRDIDALDAPVIQGALGRAVRAPSLTLLRAVDEFFITLAAWTEGHALAYRQAHAQEGLTGDALRNRIAELLADPMSDVQVKAFIRAKELAFQGKKGAILNALMTGRQAVNDAMPWGFPIGSLVFPFVTTPAKIVQMGVGLPLSPIVTLSRAVTGRYAGDGAQAVDDIARSMVGLAVVGAVLALVLDQPEDELPTITGAPGPEQGAREAAYRTAPPYSVRVGDRYLSYNRIEPLATTLAPLVSGAQEFRVKLSQGAWDAALSALGRMGAAAGDALADKTFLSSFGDIWKIVTEPEHSERYALNLGRSALLPPVIPNLITQGARASDVAIRENWMSYKDEGFWTRAAQETAYRDLPVLELAPPPRYDIWGRPITKASPWLLERLLSPAQPTGLVENVHDLDKLLMRYNERVQAGEIPGGEVVYPKAPDFFYRKDDETRYWNEKEYEYLSRESGKRAAERILRIKARLDFEEPDENDVELIRKALSDARSAVKRELLRETPSLAKKR